MTDNIDNCAKCGREFPLEELDALPTGPAYVNGIPKPWTVALLTHAADTGVDFDRLECRECYGPLFYYQGDA